MDAVRQLEIPNKEFHAFDYLMVIHDHKDPFFIRHDGVDKKTLFTHLAQSEYFIYPLYTPYQDVHKDTFSCVVAEALSLGVIVVTYPLGALPENFDGHCAWLTPPPGIDFDEMQKQQLSKDLNGDFKITSNIVEKINEIESNPELKLQLQTSASQYIVDRFNINVVGNMWVELINELTNL
jgi:glycosyltransferase involved in cell wall biosynthesis